MSQFALVCGVLSSVIAGKWKINQRLRLLNSAKFPHLVKFPRHSLFPADNAGEVSHPSFHLLRSPRGSRIANRGLSGPCNLATAREYFCLYLLSRVKGRFVDRHNAPKHRPGLQRGVIFLFVLFSCRLRLTLSLGPVIISIKRLNR